LYIKFGVRSRKRLFSSRRCHIRELRIHAALPVRVAWADSEQAIKQIAYTLDVSPKGARLGGVKGLKSTGQVIIVRRNTDEARFRVIWIGRPRTPEEGQIGIECVEDDKIIWDVDFAQAEEDFQPLGTANSASAHLWSASQPQAKSIDYVCPGSAKVWADEVDTRTEAWLTRLGFSGCELETAVRLPLNSPLVLHLNVGETQLTIKGVRREKDIAGTWIEFTHIRRGDRTILQSLIARLSKKDAMENKPIEELSGSSHSCLLYTSPEEQLAAIIPFVRAALKRGERCLYIVDVDPATRIETFRDAGIPVDEVIKAGAIVISTKRDTYLKDGNFDPGWMLQFVRDQVTAAKADGFTALRLTAEVNWIQTERDAANFLEYESKINEIIPQIGLLGMCQYHRHQVGPNMIPGILDTHPRIVGRHGIHPNLTYGQFKSRERS
jgi:MEDS: MEthanogen/methylotroph, DcmR Sensory domain